MSHTGHCSAHCKARTLARPGSLLIISGEHDNTVPWAIAHASYKQQEKNPGVTEIRELPDRGHSLVIDHGWRDVAEAALAFIAQQLQKGQ
jgi:non-heme chloroperoxidase